MADVASTGNGSENENGESPAQFHSAEKPLRSSRPCLSPASGTSAPLPPVPPLHLNSRCRGNHNTHTPPNLCFLWQRQTHPTRSRRDQPTGGAESDRAPSPGHLARPLQRIRIALRSSPRPAGPRQTQTQQARCRSLQPQPDVHRRATKRDPPPLHELPERITNHELHGQRRLQRLKYCLWNSAR